MLKGADHDRVSLPTHQRNAHLTVVAVYGGDYPTLAREEARQQALRVVYRGARDRSAVNARRSFEAALRELGV